MPMVQILDIPAPQMVEQLQDNSWYTLMPVPEPVIEVPKILLDDVPMRTAVCDSQLAEQLVEVPTIISFSSLQRIVERSVDTPVPGGGRRFAGLQGFPTEQSSAALPPTHERISERVVEQIVAIPGGGLQGFRSGQSSSASFSSPAGVHEDANVPAKKKVRRPQPPPKSEGARQRQLIHAGSSAASPRLGLRLHQ